MSMMLKGKVVVALGDRDGIPSEMIRQCAEAAGAKVHWGLTECFV